MHKVAIISLIGFCLGFWGGYLALEKTQHTSDTQMKMREGNTMNQSDTSMMNMEMQPHPMREVDKSNPIPTVVIEAVPDSMDGYNLHITTTEYTFTPEHVGEDAVANEGHAHLYVNGKKVARLYGPWFNLSNTVLQEGENIVYVTLNANDHSEWSIDGKHISAEVIITK